MKKGIVLWLIVLLCIQAKAQQDTQVSQYIFNGIYINPAYTGYKEDLFLQSYIRSQWVGVDGAPKSFSVAADGAFNDGRIGLGLTVNSDQVGAQTALSTYLNFAYRIRVGYDETSHLALGLAAGIMQLGIDGDKLTPINPGDLAVPMISQSTIMPDVNFGVYYANKRYFAGFSATNLLTKFSYDNNPDNMLLPVPHPHVYLTAGTLIPVNDFLVVKPVLLIKDDMKGPTSVDLNGFLLIKEQLIFGASYRSSIKLYPKDNLQSNLSSLNSIGLIAEFFATPLMRVGYSYDHSLNSLGHYNYGSHELSIGFYLGSVSGANDNAARCFKF